jgi:hypothetical protein
MTQLAKQQSSIALSSLPNTSSKELQLYNAHQTAKKVKDYSTKEDLLLINSLILRWAQYVGIKQPEASDVNTIANFIRENHQNFNAYDISECINLLANQKLNTDAEHYGSLSVIYVSKVLKAYQVHKGEVLFKVREQIRKVEELKVVPPSSKERISNFKQILLNGKEEVNKGEIYFDTGEIIYGFIKHNKLILMNKNLIDEAMEYGLSIFRKKSKSQALKDVINNVTFSKLVKEDIVRRYAREHVVNVWLKQTDVQAVNEKITIQMLQY